MLGVGVWMKVDLRVANLGQAISIGLNEQVVDIVAWIFIGTGIFVFVVGFMGCCGAIKESRILLGFVSMGPELRLQHFLSTNQRSLGQSKSSKVPPHIC